MSSSIGFSGSVRQPWDVDADGRASPYVAEPPPRRHHPYFEQLAGMGIGFGRMVMENFGCHPFIVLRRQCQVNHLSTCAHLTPFTLMPVIFNLQRNQGALPFWKGAPSTVALRGLGYGAEVVLGDVFGLPRQVNWQSPSRKIARHCLLKSLAAALTTPFVATVFVETVQSARASEPPSLAEFVSEGLRRVSSDGWAGRDGSRRFSVWHLLVPSVAFRLGHYLVRGLSERVVVEISNKPRDERTVFDKLYPELFASMASSFIADLILFPVETVLNRLYLQGTRTIIDDLDFGLEVIPITTRYEGVFDCVLSIFRSEGVAGFYKGLGAAVLQYMLHFLLLSVARSAFARIEEAFVERPPPSRQHLAALRAHRFDADRATASAQF